MVYFSYHCPPFIHFPDMPWIFDERADTLGLWWKDHNVGLCALLIATILNVSSSFESFFLVGRQMRDAEIQARLIYTRFLGFTSRLVCHDYEAIPAKISILYLFI